jgi:pimeloyl-ACP methyl ester carboxylesterase
MIRLGLVVFLLLTFWAKVTSYAQNPITGTDCLQFEIISNAYNIDFIQVAADSSVVKPAMIFLQGSLPLPLVIDVGDYKHINLPFDFKKVVQEFHLFVIAMPHTPVEATMAQLNDQYCFVPDSTRSPGFDKNYLASNTLENYTSRTSQVIREIVKLSWVDGEIHLVGHSQGAKIAAVAASENPEVTSAALLAFNAFGRYDEKIRKDRDALKTDKIDGIEYQHRIEDHYERWKHIQQNPDDYESGNNAWVSFSIDYLPWLLKTEIPLWVGYGNEDISAENCDLLPLHFISAGKENLQLKPYPGWDHNFFDSEGTMHWNTVMEDVVRWIKAIE